MLYILFRGLERVNSGQKYTENQFDFLQLALSFWLEEFGVDGEALEESGAALVKEYQISPQVNEKAYLINKGCHFHANGMYS